MATTLLAIGGLALFLGIIVVVTLFWVERQVESEEEKELTRFMSEW